MVRIILVLALLVVASPCFADVRRTTTSTNRASQPSREAASVIRLAHVAMTSSRWLSRQWHQHLYALPSRFRVVARSTPDVGAIPERLALSFHNGHDSPIAVVGDALDLWIDEAGVLSIAMAVNQLANTTRALQYERPKLLIVKPLSSQTVSVDLSQFKRVRVQNKINGLKSATLYLGWGHVPEPPPLMDGLGSRRFFAWQRVSVVPVLLTK